MARTFGTTSLADVIRSATADAVRDAAVALPGIVVSYNAVTETATIKPAISRLVQTEDEPEEDEPEELPAIPDVKIIWYRARGISIAPPISSPGLLPGDPVLLVCCDRDISSWMQSGAVSEPDDYRSHSWGNAVAFPGLTPTANPFPAPADAAALASKVDAIGRYLATAVAATTPAETMAAVNLILLAFKESYPTILSTCASTILKVSS